MAAASEGLEKLEDMIVRQAEATGAQVAAAKAAIGAVIFGQDRVVEQALITILSGGHALLIGLPGLAKTKLVETMGVVLGLDARRIQFTPDLMPSDIVGSEVLEESPGGKRSFRFIPGPIFGQLLMADEINRASPRTQSKPRLCRVSAYSDSGFPRPTIRVFASLGFWLIGTQKSPRRAPQGGSESTR